MENQTVSEIERLYSNSEYGVAVLLEKKLEVNSNVSVVEFEIVPTNLYESKKSVRAWISNPEKQVLQLQYLNEGY